MEIPVTYLQHLTMVMVQVGFAGLNVMSKLAMNTGMSPYVLVSYRQIIAFFFLFLLAFFFERCAIFFLSSPFSSNILTFTLILNLNGISVMQKYMEQNNQESPLPDLHNFNLWVGIG